MEWIAGRCEVFHGTNFVLPPAQRAAGVVTIHDLTYLRYRETVDDASRAYRELVPTALRRAAVVLTPSRTVAAEVVDEYGVDPDLVVPTPLGVSHSWRKAEPAPEWWYHQRGLPTRYLVFVGTQEPRKDLATLLAAHAEATRRDPDVPDLVLAGPAGWGAAVSTTDRVHRTGYLAAADLRTVVAGAVGLVLPTRYEGFGLPLLEALAVGVPVLASDLPVLREVGGDAVSYAPPGDVDAWQESLVEGRWHDLDHAARAGLRRYASRWDWDSCARSTAAAYRRAAQAPR